MMMKTWNGIALAAALNLVVALPAWAQAEPAPAAQLDRAMVEKRLEAVDTLLEKSSAARQVDASGNTKALELRDKARALHRSAREAFAAGDLAGANRQAQGATTVMFEAVHLARPEQITAEKAQTDYRARLESVKALLAAQKRISAEKANVNGAAQTTREIERLTAEAERLVAAGKVAEGRAVLDRAYLIAKAAIGDLRGGDTLVRSLKFNSKEEEFHYELDRNDTHRMLIKLLLDEKRGSGDLDKMVSGFVDRAAQLRRQAEMAAARGDYDAAVKSLEDSTAELVRAIRNAGVYIPG